MQRKNTPNACPTAALFYRSTRLAQTRYGLEPRLELKAMVGTHFRALRAELHRVAADLELASLDAAWIVRVEQDDAQVGHIALELADGHEVEMTAAMQVLNAMAAKAVSR